VQRAVLIHIMRDRQNKGENTDQLLTGIGGAAEVELMRNKHLSYGGSYRITVGIEGVENTEKINMVNRLSFKLLNDINVKSPVRLL
jgi:hypothetical protein